MVGSTINVSCLKAKRLQEKTRLIVQCFSAELFIRHVKKHKLAWMLDVGREGFNGLSTLAPLLIKRVALWSAPFLSFGYLWKKLSKDVIRME